MQLALTATDRVPQPSVHTETLFQTKMRLGVVPESIKTSIVIGLYGSVFGDIAVKSFLRLF
jgi:hypothetical protein